MKWAALTLAMIAGWCVAVLPAYAAEDEARVVILNGFDPYLPSYMDINLRAASPADGLYASNATVLELQRVENQLGRLAPPSWPEEIFGKIDRAKAQAGKALFMSESTNSWPISMPMLKANSETSR